MKLEVGGVYLVESRYLKGDYSECQILDLKGDMVYASKGSRWLFGFMQYDPQWMKQEAFAEKVQCRLGVYKKLGFLGLKRFVSD